MSKPNGADVHLQIAQLNTKIYEINRDIQHIQKQLEDVEQHRQDAIMMCNLLHYDCVLIEGYTAYEHDKCVQYLKSEIQISMTHIEEIKQELAKLRSLLK